MREISKLGGNNRHIVSLLPEQEIHVGSAFVFIQHRDIAEATSKNTPSDTAMIRWRNFCEFVLYEKILV